MSEAEQLPLPVGIDPLYSNCVIKFKSGSKFYTFIGAVVACSPVFRDLVECCGAQPSAEDGDGQGSSSAAQTSNTKEMFEIPLEDPDDEINALVEYLHQPDRILRSVVPTVTKEGAVSILHLAPIAFKYDMQGNIYLHGPDA
jgi:hypothetical protein